LGGQVQFLSFAFFWRKSPKETAAQGKIKPDTSGVSIDLLVGFSQGKGQKAQNKANPTSVN